MCIIYLAKTPSFSIELSEQGQFSISNVVEGDGNDDILKRIDYNIESLLLSYQNQLQRSGLAENTKAEYFAYLQDSLQQTNYLKVPAQ